MGSSGFIFVCSIVAICSHSAIWKIEDRPKRYAILFAQIAALLVLGMAFGSALLPGQIAIGLAAYLVLMGLLGFAKKRLVL